MMSGKSEKDGCEFGKANRYMIAGLLTIIGIISVYHLRASSDLKAEISELNGTLNSASVQNGRLEERLEGALDSLKRIEAKLDTPAARATAMTANSTLPL